MSTSDKHPTEALVDKVPLLDVSRGNNPLSDEFNAALAAVVSSGRFVFGPDCSELETELAELSGAKHGIGCASGSDALLLSLMAKEIGRGDEVIVPSFTFFATASAVWRLGATPVFVDIDADSFNLDPEAVAEAVNPATRAIIPVHLFGQCAEMEAINEIAAKHDLCVIEDACQAIGAQVNGQGAGSIGDFGCFSFYPTKNLGGMGDGGMITTDCDESAEQLRRLRNHGMHPRYYHDSVGVNSRLDSFQAAVLRVKLRHLAQWTEDRRTNAARYTQLLTDAGLHETLTLPGEGDGNYHVWNQYTIRVPGGRRDDLRGYLQAAGVGSEIYYPVPLHQQACFAELGYGEGSLPETAKAAAEVLSLPIFPELTAEEQTTVVHHIGKFYAQAAGKEAA